MSPSSGGPGTCNCGLRISNLMGKEPCLFLLCPYCVCWAGLHAFGVGELETENFP